MVKINDLPTNAVIYGNKYSYEINDDANHILLVNEKFSINNGRRYVVGWFINDTEAKDFRTLTIAFTALAAASALVVVSSNVAAKFCPFDSQLLSTCGLSMSFSLTSMIASVINLVRVMPLLR